MDLFDKYPISKAIQLPDGSTVLMLDMYEKSRDFPLDDIHHNIYRRHADGRILWRIDAEPPMFERSSFTGMGFEDGQFFAYRSEGIRYQIDLETGSACGNDWSAALRNHPTACTSSNGTALPFSYIIPSSFWAPAKFCLAHRRNQFNASE